MSGVEIRQRAASEGQRGGRRGQEGQPAPLLRASWSTAFFWLPHRCLLKHRFDCKTLHICREGLKNINKHPFMWIQTDASINIFFLLNMILSKSRS